MKLLKLIAMVALITPGVDASATEKAITKGAEKAAAEDIVNLRRSSGSRSSSSRGSSSSRSSYGRTTTTRRRYGDAYAGRSYYRRPSMVEQVAREVDRNILRPLDRATRDARRELEDVVVAATAVHVSALFGPKEKLAKSLLGVLPNPETCKVPAFVDCVMKRGQNKFVMPKGDARQNLFTDTCAKDNGCLAPGQMGSAMGPAMGNLASAERDMEMALGKFTSDWYSSVDKFIVTNFSRLIEMSSGMYTGQIKDTLVKYGGCPQDCVDKHVDRPADWAGNFYQACGCTAELPWTQLDESDAVQASDLYLVSLSEWIERASQVTEEEYNNNQFAQLLNEEFGNPFEKGLYIESSQEAEEQEDITELKSKAQRARDELNEYKARAARAELEEFKRNRAKQAAARAELNEYKERMARQALAKARGGKE